MTPQELEGWLRDREGRHPPRVGEILAAHPPASSYSISDATMAGAVDVVLAGHASNVLEIGAGRSSAILATALAEAGGGTLTSIESAPQFCEREWALIRQMDTVDGQLLVAPVALRAGRAGMHYWFDGALDSLSSRGPFDLVLVDAPHQSFGREASLHLAFPHLTAPAVVVLDDACRPGERRVLEHWRQCYPDLRLVARDCREKHGYAVLVSGGSRTTWPGPAAWLASVRDRWRRRPKVRAQRALEAGQP